VEELTGAPVALLSTSPDRDDTINGQRSFCGSLKKVLMVVALRCR